MLKHIQIENYRSLRHVDVALRPLTVLVGPNDTGKSTFLNAIRRALLPIESVSLDDRWQRDSDNKVKIVCNLSHGVLAYDERAASTRGWGSHKDALERQHFGKYASIPLFQLPAQGIPMVSRGLTDADGPQMPDATGSGISGLLDYWNRKDHRRKVAVESAMRSLVAGLRELTIGSPDPQSRRIDFVVEDQIEINGNEASAGVRLLLFFVSIAHHPDPPGIILIEEPETGIHPRRLADVMKLLRAVANGGLGGKSAQVILTTHSPYLLDCVDLDTDQVLVFRRENDGSRTAEAVDRARLSTFLDEFMLGEVWFNRGEEGLVARR